MTKDFIYTIYSHSDADGGIAAAIFSKFINEKYKWNTDIQPINHMSPSGDWNLKEIKWPCAILDFTLHPSFLSSRFFQEKFFLEKQNNRNIIIPDCYWIDHHPTGSSFPFLTEKNTTEIISNVITKWDVTAISTPGLLRTHCHELGFPVKIIKEYQDFIDLAEIIDGALFVNCEAAYDFSSYSVKLQTLFNPSHPVIDRVSLYKKIVRQIAKDSSVENLFDSDIIYQAILNYEEQIFNKQLRAYSKVTRLNGKVAFANFNNRHEFFGMGRFLPYMLFEDANYALHIFPSFSKSHLSISCGINPWNKPKNYSKHLGNYFARNFSGGGHSFVAGGKIAENEYNKIDKLFDYLNE